MPWRSSTACSAIAIIIAVIGIGNTISLSVHERTRELGLLRAVGQSRRQTRTMVRWESVIVAVFGTLGGHRARHVRRVGDRAWRSATDEGFGTFAVPVDRLADRGRARCASPA